MVEVELTEEAVREERERGGGIQVSPHVCVCRTNKEHLQPLIGLRVGRN